MTPDDDQTIQADARALVDEAIAFARESPDPDPTDAFTDVFVNA
jgi:TPP-dependent pyruvate/acetoin dehydrogenase alpha subunit